MNKNQIRKGYGFGLFLIQIGVILLIISSIIISLTDLVWSFIGIGLTIIGLGLGIFLYFKGNPKEKRGYLGKWTDVFNPFRNPLFRNFRKC